jgi:hypothetical protein
LEQNNTGLPKQEISENHLGLNLFKSELKQRERHRERERERERETETETETEREIVKERLYVPTV